MEMTMALDGSAAASTQQEQQLERMGRELKCPICLSLFKQAASLSCNHCFCMSCILTSMKSTSSCPICKVPAARREVRAAPQMDNLVAIYRGMELAVGVTIFATQQTQEATDNKQDNAGCGKRGRPAKRSRRLMAFDKLDPAQEKRKINSAALADITNAKQSLKRFPTKKRVQVPQFETEEVLRLDDAEHFGNMSAGGSKPTIRRDDMNDTMRRKSRKKRQRKLADEDKEANVLSLNDFNDFGTEHGGAKCWDFRQCGVSPVAQHSGTLIRKPEDTDSHAQDLNEKNRTREQDFAPQKCAKNGALAPFFWLRESPSQEEEDDCTQAKQTQTTQAQPVVVPSFSDLKDSEDLQDEQDMDEVAKGGGTDDGDAFFWTQHPSSPELHCTPSEEQRNLVVEDTLQSEDPSFCIALFQEDHKHNDNVDQQGNNKHNGKDCELQPIKSGTPEDLAGTSGGGNHEKLAEHHISLLGVSEDGGLLCSTDGSEDATRAVQSTPKRYRESVISRSVGQPPAASNEAVCAFCQVSGDSAIAGQLMLYKDGVLVHKLSETSTNAMAAHKLCAEWAPDVYFTEKEDEIRNLEAEVARGQKLKCSSCGLKGAALGCCLKRCRKSFHYACARASKCKWHMEKFIILCPDHAGYEFPVKKGSSRKTSKSSTRPNQLIDSNHMSVRHKDEDKRLAFKKDAHAAAEQKWPSGPSYKWVICGSGLDAHGKEQLAKFASVTGATLETSWNQKITHVVTGTDEGGAARRTMKFLMGILEGKWVLKVDWMAACLSAGHAVNEAKFEICSDIHGMLEGPKRGRSLAASEAPKLFEGLSFFLTNQFERTLKADLQALVQTGGGIVLHRKPIPTSSSSKKGSDDALSKGDSVLVIYYDDASAGKLDRRKQEAMSVAKSAGAVALGHTWLLDSAAGCKLQPVSN